MSKQDKHFYQFGLFRLDGANGLLLRDGEEIPLQRRAFEVLLFLVEHNGQVLTKDELMQALWPDSFVEEANLTQHIYMLRRALGGGPQAPQYIVTVPGRGYRFKADVQEAGEVAETVVIENHTLSRVTITEAGADDRQVAGTDGPLTRPVEVEVAAGASPRPAKVSFPAALPARKKIVSLGLLILSLVVPGLGLLLYRVTQPAPPKEALPPPRVMPLTTLPGVESEPSLSPDGKQVAFAWDGGAEGNANIYVKLIDVGVPLRLTTNPAHNHQPVWSPDGRYIAFLRRTGNEEEVWIVPALGGQERKLAQVVGGGLDWSPDGKFLAVVDHIGAQETRGIFLLSVETGEKHQITSPPAAMIDFSPVFSPDGKTMAFGRAISNAVEEIYLVAVAGGEPRPLTSARRRLGGLAWTPNGREIIFSSDREGAFNLWRVAATGGAPERVTAVSGGAFGVTIARQGARLAYAQQYSDTNIWRLELSGEPGRAAGGKPERLIVSSRQEDSPQFSPDGQKIAFASTRSGSPEIWVCDRDGTNPAPLTSFGGPQTGSPCWSPDGEWLAFDSRPDGQSDIFVISAQGGQPRRLTTAPSSDVVPSWSRDGRWIYFASNRTGERQVWKMAATGGPAMQITKQGGFESVESPDGKSLYYSKRDLDGIFKVPVEGGQEVPVPELSAVGYYRYWAVTESGIYFVPRQPGARPVLNFFSFVTGQVHQAAALEKPPVYGPLGLAVSPDGRWALYTQEDQLASDIMLVENFR